MVFNKYYDRALLLMLLGDKDNNEMIINFLKFMPEEMHKYIRNFISLNSYLAVRGDFRTVSFERMSILTNECIHYMLKCAIVHGMLEIKLSRCNQNINVNEIIELSLQPLRRYEIDANVNIGSFYYELNNKNEDTFYSKRYSVKKIIFDNLLVTSGINYNGKLISIDSCFEEISLESLFNDKRFNSNGRKRVLTNKKRGNR